MDSEDQHDYFKMESRELQMLKDLKSHKKTSIESLKLLAQYCILANQKKNYLEKAISTIGGKKLSEILDLIYTTDLLTLGDAFNVELFSFLGLILGQNHIEEINQWISKCFSPLIWLRLSRLFLKNLLLAYPAFLKDYETIAKKQHATTDLQASMFMENVFLLFSNKFASLSFDVVDSELRLCEKVLEFVLIAVSTPQSRLATIQLVQDRQFFIKNQMFLRYLQAKYAGSATSEKLSNVDRFMRMLKRFVNFDIMGESRIAKRTILVHYDTFQEFQRLLFHHFSEKVEHYVVKSVGSADTREKLMEIFSYLSEEDLRLIANRLNIFVPEADDTDPVLNILTEDRGFKVIVEEILVFKLKSRASILSKIKSMPLFPTQKEIWSSFNDQFRGHGISDGTLQSVAVDRATLGFINLEDYLIRHFNLWRQAFSLAVRDSLEEVVPKLRPQLEYTTGHVQAFEGWTPDSLEIKEFTVFEVEKPKIGKNVPETVFGEVLYSTIDINSATKHGWENIKIKDSLFLLSFRRTEVKPGSIENELEQKKSDVSFPDKFNLAQVRGCELIGHLDEERHKIHATGFKVQREIKPRGTNRYLQLHLDPHQYMLDLRGDSQNRYSRNSAFNIVVKSKVGSPNYKACLTLIAKFLEQHMEVADWIVSAVMGKTYSQHTAIAKHQQDAKLSLNSLFADDAQMKETLTGSQSVKEFADHFDSKSEQYRSDGRRLYPAQLEAVVGSLLPGIHLIEAGPGTGKATVVSELVLQTLANYGEERVLIVSRSDHAITRMLSLLASNIAEDFIMRLDAGPKDADFDFSQLGRVNHVLKRRLELLEKLQEIAASIGLNIHTQLTCETAEILFKSQFLSRWSAYETEFNSKKPQKRDQMPRYPFGRFDLLSGLDV